MSPTGILVFYLDFDLHISLCCVFNISLEHVCNYSLGVHSLSLYGKQQHEHFSKYLILCSMDNLKHSNFSKSLLWSQTHLVHSIIVNSILQTLMIQILHKVWTCSISFHTKFLSLVFIIFNYNDLPSPEGLCMWIVSIIFHSNDHFHVKNTQFIFYDAE